LFGQTLSSFNMSWTECFAHTPRGGATSSRPSFTQQLNFIKLSLGVDINSLGWNFTNWSCSLFGHTLTLFDMSGYNVLRSHHSVAPPVPDHLSTATAWFVSEYLQFGLKLYKLIMFFVWAHVICIRYVQIQCFAHTPLGRATSSRPPFTQQLTALFGSKYWEFGFKLYKLITFFVMAHAICIRYV
jgi:hypothetical protein